jgi:uncharacterized protein (TIGR03083 family)
VSGRPQEELAGHIDVWRLCIADVVALLRSLDEQDWLLPTDLPGWDVRAVAAHLAHLESLLAGISQPEVEDRAVPEGGPRSARLTSAGLRAREGVAGPALVEELEAAAALRSEQLRADPPRDPSAPSSVALPGFSKDWGSLLSNRVLDVWMHEQDVRRAVGRPGGLNSAGAAHTVRALNRSFPYLVGKRLAPPPGTTVLLVVEGSHPLRVSVGVDAAGRAAAAVSEPSRHDLALTMGVDAYCVLSGGRRSADDVDVVVSGDLLLGRRLLEALAITP